jgi:SAM-dependent MidA family methyltransferase
VLVTPLLIKELEKSSWLSMEGYMELALYHPQAGYYMNENKKIGKNGDFYTSSLVSDVFGKVWANLFARVINENQLDPVVVEFGGGSGHFAKQVLSTWKKMNVSNISYIMVERSPFHRKLLKEQLTDLPVMILGSLQELKQAYPVFKGVIFANEVLDAFPLRMFKWLEGSWFEKGVACEKDSKDLAFRYKKIEDPALHQSLDKVFKKRNKEFELEVSFQMLRWLKEIYCWTNKDTFYFFVDYGYFGDEWNNAQLKEGSIRGYYRHQIENHPLAHPGEMDITYHVDWDQVMSGAEDYGVETVGFTRQGEFLLKEGLLSELKNSQLTDPFSIEHRRNRAVRTFLLDSMLANGFQVIQQKKRAE